MSFHQVQRIISGLIPGYAKEGIKYLISEDFREAKRRSWEIRRLQELPRREPTATDLLGTPIELTDAASFIWQYRSIFEEEAYAFTPRQKPPVIIDGGANIGLTTLYWKQQFPKAQITAFEPGPHVFDALKVNIERFGLDNVELLQKGLWKEEGSLTFESDKAEGGHFSQYSAEDSVETTEVPVTRLSPYLEVELIDMVKLDIEGAEVEVLLEAADNLDSVDHLFVEYHSYPEEEQELDVLLKVLREADFRIHIQPERVAQQPFIERPVYNGMDHNLNIFAYRN